MWTATEPVLCSVCSKGFRSKEGRKVYVCKQCLLLHIPAMHAQSTKFFTFDSAECGCCGVSSSHKRLCQLWTTFCVPCSLSLKHVENLTSRITFLQQFKPCPLDEDFSGDVSLIVGDAEIQAHRLVLGSKSPVFKTMMEVDMKEKITGKVHIEGFTAAVVQAAVNCMYTAEIDFSVMVTPEEVLRFAHRYQVMWLKKLCEEALVKTITGTNLVQLLSVSYTYEAEVLKAELKKSLTSNPTLLSNAVDDIFSYLGGGCSNCKT